MFNYTKVKCSYNSHTLNCLSFKRSLPSASVRLYPWFFSFLFVLLFSFLCCVFCFVRFHFVVFCVVFLFCSSVFCSFLCSVFVLFVCVLQFSVRLRWSDFCVVFFVCFVFVVSPALCCLCRLQIVHIRDNYIGFLKLLVISSVMIKKNVYGQK